MQKLLVDFNEDLDVDELPNDNIRETSKDAYNTLKTITNEINKRQLEYLKALDELNQPSTDYEVARHNKHNDPNYFRPRRYELMKKGLVIEAGKRQCRITYRTCIIWQLTDQGKQTLEDIRVD